MPLARAVTSFLHGSKATFTAVVLAVAACVVAMLVDAVPPMLAPSGVVLPSANLWVENPIISDAVNTLVIIIIALAMLYVNRIFNVLRSLTHLVATIFLIIMASTPSMATTLYSGTVAALLLILCTMLMFSTYGKNPDRRTVFLIFFLIVGAATTRVCYLFFLPAMLFGTMQMGIFSPRTFLAALLGAITPVWIVFGVSLLWPVELRWPDEAFSLIPAFDFSDALPLLVTVAFTMLLGLGFMVANLMKILSYNARVRSFNGFLTMLLIYTALLIILNFGNIRFYVPLLNCLAAYQIGHFFTYRRTTRSYIPILAIIACYIALYTWSITTNI